MLVDTSVLIDALNPRRTRRVLLADLSRRGHRLSTSTINAAEVYAGMRSGEEARTATLLEDFLVLPVTMEIARRAGRLVYDHARVGRTLALTDMIVAATALEFGYTVMTDNRRDFDIAGLTLYSFS